MGPCVLKILWRCLAFVCQMDLHIFNSICFSWLTHWGRVTHICVSKVTIIGSDNSLLPGRCQAITWTNAGIVLIRSLGTKLRESWGENYIFSLKKMHLKMSSGNWWPFCLGLNVLSSKVGLFEIQYFIISLHGITYNHYITYRVIVFGSLLISDP